LYIQAFVSGHAYQDDTSQGSAAIEIAVIHEASPGSMPKSSDGGVLDYLSVSPA
jgi:hypothetical protein